MNLILPSPLLGVLAFGRSATFVLSHIIIIIIVYFRTPRGQSIFGLHRQRQKVRHGHNCVGSIGIYVVLH